MSDEPEFETGNADAAEKSYQTCLELTRTLTVGPSHRLLPVVQMRLAEVLGYRLKIAEADRNFREAIESAERIYGRNHDIYVENIFNYGNFLLLNSQGGKAIPLLREAVETASHQGGRRELPEFQGPVSVRVALVD